MLALDPQKSSTRISASSILLLIVVCSVALIAALLALHPNRVTFLAWDEVPVALRHAVTLATLGVEWVVVVVDLEPPRHERAK